MIFDYDETKIDSAHVKLTDEMLCKDKECATLISECEQHIPVGTYCYDNSGLCPFFDFHPQIDYHTNGYCHLMHNGDWFTSDRIGLLWDQVKICGINECRIEDNMDKGVWVRSKSKYFNNQKLLDEIKQNWKPCGECGYQTGMSFNDHQYCELPNEKKNLTWVQALTNDYVIKLKYIRKLEDDIKELKSDECWYNINYCVPIDDMWIIAWSNADKSLKLVKHISEGKLVDSNKEYSFDDFNFWTPAPEFPSEIKNCFIIKK